MTNLKKFGCFLAIAPGAVWVTIEWLCFGSLVAAIAGIGFAMGCMAIGSILGKRTGGDAHGNRSAD